MDRQGQLLHHPGACGLYPRDVEGIVPIAGARRGFHDIGSIAKIMNEATPTRPGGKRSYWDRMAEVMGVQLQVDADVLAQQPSDAELEAYYQAHKDKYAGEGIMVLRDLIIRPTRDMSEDMALGKAREAADAFRKGRESDDIAA